MLNDRSSHENDPGIAGPSETPPAAAGSRDHGAPTAENVRDIPAGGSTSRRKLAVTGADFASAEPPLENDKTVISKGAPVAPPTNLPVPLRPHEMGRELEGQRLNHFMLEEFVGGGGMGAVFRAIDTELGRTVAVKVVSKDATDDEVLRRFKNEAQSAARLDHPNIARVYYVGQDRGWNYIVFEYIEGVNVRDLVDHKGPLSLDEAVHYTRQVAEALDHASRRDVVHRDIKPSNVLVMPDGRVKLVDMGLARLHQVEASSQDLTASGVTLGTFDYISPEQARDPRNTDVRSDLYSLGCTIYFMLTGLPPFPEGTVLQKLLSHSSEEPPDPRRLRGDLPDELVRIVMKLLAKQPEKRYQRPSELIGELILLADELGLPHSDRSGPVWVTTEAAERNWLERHLPWIAPTAILLGAVLFVELSSRSDSSLRIPDPKLPTPIREASAAERSDSLHTPNRRTADLENDAPAANEAVSPSPIEAVRPTVAPPVPSAEPPSPLESARASTSNGTNAAVDDGRESTPRAVSADAPEAGNALASASTASPLRATSAPTSPTRSPEPRASGTNAAAPSSASTVANGTKPPSSESTSTGNSTAVTNVVAAAATNPMPSVDLEDMRAQEALNDRVRTIVVGGPDTETSADDAYRVDSLSKAARLLPQMANVREIVLASDSFIEDTFTLADHNLEIRAADGFQPLIVFGRNATNFSDSRQMIRMVGGGVTWRGIQFRLEVPTMLSGSVALFGVNQVETLKFDQCAMTIVNATESGVAGSAAATFLEIDAPNSASGMMNGNGMMLPVQPIGLTDCVARGEATFVRVPEATPLRLEWEQGLLAISERLLETGGCERDPKQAMSEVELFRVVVRADQGLCRLDSTQRPYQIGLRLELQESIIVTRPGAALVQHLGFSAEEFQQYVERRFAWEDRNSCYPNADPATTIRWQVLREDSDQPVVFDLLAEGQTWYHDMGVTFADPWQTPLPSAAFHRQHPADYVAKAADMESMRLGLDLARMPTLAE